MIRKRRSCELEEETENERLYTVENKGKKGGSTCRKRKRRGCKVKDKVEKRQQSKR